MSFGLPVASFAGSSLRPLEEAVRQEQSPAMLAYVLKRCSGVYLAASMRAGPSQDPKRQFLYAESQKMAGRFIALAQQLAEKAKLPDTSDSLVKDTTDIGVLYAEMMQQSYLSSGNAMSDEIMADMRLCRSLLEQSQR